MRSNSKLMLPCLFLSIIYFSVRTLRAPFSSARGRTSGYLSRQRVDLVRIRALFFPLCWGLLLWVALRVRPRTCFFLSSVFFFALPVFPGIFFSFIYAYSHSPSPFYPSHSLPHRSMPQRHCRTRATTGLDGVPNHVC